MTKLHDAATSIIASVAFFFIGQALAFFLNLDVPIVSINSMPIISLLLLSVSVFVFSMLFFGALTPLFFLLVGASQINLLKEMPLVLVIFSIPLFIMGFAGTFFGMLLREDLEGKDNIYNYKNQLIGFFVVGVIIAIIVGYLYPQLAETSALLLTMLP